MCVPKQFIKLERFKGEIEDEYWQRLMEGGLAVAERQYRYDIKSKNMQETAWGHLPQNPVHSGPTTIFTSMLTNHWNYGPIIWNSC